MKERLKLFYRAAKYRFLADRQEIAYLMKKIRKGQTVLDIGAHKGAYTFWMHRAAGSTGLTVAFEPQKKGADLLLNLFPMPSVAVEHKAVSDKNGKSVLNIQPQSFDVSFEASLSQQYAQAMREEVETVTLDSYCAGRQLAPAFIKIDVEGHEAAVLSGASEILHRFHPTLLIEAETRHTGPEQVTALFASLLDLGYKGFFFKEKQKLPLEDFNPGIDQDLEQLGSRRYLNNFVFE